MALMFITDIRQSPAPQLSCLLVSNPNSLDPAVRMQRTPESKQILFIHGTEVCNVLPLSAGVRSGVAWNMHPHQQRP